MQRILFIIVRMDEPKMNPQPYQTPPNWWPSRLSPAFVRLSRFWRTGDLKKLGIREVEVFHGERIKESLDSGAGVLILPNHSFHYDSHVMIEAGLRNSWYTHFMSAWQVFQLAGGFGRHMLQRHGAFSINREGTDTKAFRQAQTILGSDPHALVIFPEGDLYHSNDRVMPFREGSAGIALSAAKKSERPIHVYPAVMKCFYTKDPTYELVEMMNQLENRIRWRPRPDLPLMTRIYRFGEGFLASKEIEYTGKTQPGELPVRLRKLAKFILEQVRTDLDLKSRGNDVVDQIRSVRGALIRLIEKAEGEIKQGVSNPDLEMRLQKLQFQMDDMFLVTQLSSYHGNYTVENPTIERIAETIDKFEEDVFELQYPTPRGERKAVVEFGERIDITNNKFTASELTKLAEDKVQGLMDTVNARGVHK